jgi:hypothetical protein
MKLWRNIVLLVIASFLLSTVTKGQELIKINDTLYRATKDVPIIISVNSTSVYLETTNFGREQANVPLDTILARACTKYFKATLQDGRVYAFNKDFVRRVASRTNNRSYVYMIHTPTRYDIIESVSVLAQRMALCGGVDVFEYQELYLQGDSLYITNGNGVPLDSMLEGISYTAGTGIDITANRITNTGDTNPLDDVLKTTNHDGDVTGVYNMLVVKDGAITINKLDSLNVLTWIIDNFPLIDSTRFDTTNILTWIYNHVDTTDLDEQTLYIQGDSLYITNGNGIPLDSIRSGELPGGERGETLWYDGTDWIVDSSIYNDGAQVGVHAPLIWPGTMTVYGDTIMTFSGDTTYMRVITKGNNIWFDYKGEWFIIKDSTELTGGFGVRSGTLKPRYEVAIPGRITIGGIHDNSTGESNAMFFGQDAMTGSILDAAPTGTSTYNTIKIAGQINQFSGTGVTRGILIQPAINGAADYRGIEIANSSGIGIRQSGELVTNRIFGKTSFGSLLTPARAVHNYGQTRLQTPVTGADGLAGIHLANGDVAHVALGGGLYMSGDTLYSTAFGDDGLNGEGVPNYLAKWTPDSTSLGISQFYDNGTNMGLNNTAPVRKLDVTGDMRVSGSVDTASASKVWVGNAAGDLRKVNMGSDLIVQGDSIKVVGGVAGDGSPYYLARWAPDSTTLNTSTVYDSFRVGINTKVPDAALEVRGDANDVNLFRIARQEGDKLYEVDSTGAMFIGNASTRSYIYPYGGSSTPNINNRGIGFYSRSTVTLGHYFGGINVGNSAGTYPSILAERTWNPASGSGTFKLLELKPTINQGGSATGRSYGLYIEPVLTSSAEWIGAYTTGTDGTGFLQEGSSQTNRFEGNTTIGSAIAGVRTGQITGDFRVTEDVDTATVSNLWGANTLGDFNKVLIGSGLDVTGDSISASYYWSLEDGAEATSFLEGDVLTVLGTGSVTATLDTATKTLTINGAGPAGDGGETNLGLNVGPGEEIYKGKTDTTLLFRTLVDQGIAEVNQVGDSVIINVPAQTLSVSNDSIFISLGNGVKVPNVPANGTVLNSTLRWSGSAWVENDSLLVNADGEAAAGGAAINTARSIVTTKDVEINTIRVGTGNSSVPGNTAVGVRALNVIGALGGDNTAIGYETLQGLTGNASRNTAVGMEALRTANSGGANTAIGRQALRSSTNASENTALGGLALFSTSTSGSNVGVGYEAGRTLSGAGRTFNTVMGHNVGRNGLYANSTFLGAAAGFNSSSSNSVFIGRNAGFSVNKDSTLLIDVTSDTVATIVGDFRGRKVGINRNPFGIARRLDVGGDLRVRDDVDSTTVTQFWAGNLEGDLKRMYIGDGLGIVGDTIKVTYVEQPPSPYILAQNESISPYTDTIASNNSKNIRFPNIGPSQDWVLSANQIEYQGLDSLMSKIHVEVDLSASNGTLIEFRLRANVFGGTSMDVIHRRRISLNGDITNISLDYLYGVAPDGLFCPSSGAASLFDVEITNVSGDQRTFTIYTASISNIKVGEYEPTCPL